MSEETIVDAGVGQKECTHCGKMVSAKPGPYAIHLKRCMASVSVEKPETVLSRAKNEDIKRVMEKAIANQQSMLEAPDLGTIDLSVDVNMSLRKRYAPETIPAYDSKGRALHTHTEYFGDAREMSVDISKGFVPKLNENGEYVVNMGGDILYTRPREITEKITREQQLESQRRLANVTIQSQQKSSADGIDAPGNSGGEIKEEEYGRVGMTPAFKPGEI